MVSYCCTCAAPLSAAFPAVPAAPHRQLPCCDRFVCGHCLTKNARFATYCPYCQIATAPPPPSSAAASSKASHASRAASKDILPPGLKPPPPYRRFGAAAQRQDGEGEAPPPYSSLPSSLPSNLHKPPAATREPLNEKGGLDDDDDDEATPIIHYLDHDRDSVASLSLRYNVPTDLLRRANHLASDHLLLARRVVQIPATAATTATSALAPVSLSPSPVEGEGEARRKAAIRRFMVACKVADYDLAVLYLEQTAEGREGDGDLAYDLGAAVAAFQADEQWERAHPVEAARQKEKARAKKQGTSSSTSGGGFFSRRRQHHPSSSSSSRPV